VRRFWSVAAAGLIAAFCPAPARADVDLCATASCSGQTATGTISAGSSTLHLASAKDFADGQAVRIEHAGAAASVGAPSRLGVSVVGEPGSTSYHYRVAALDAHGGVSAATPPAGSATGNAELGPNDYIDIRWDAASGSPPGYAVWRSVDGGPFEYLKLVNHARFWDFGITDAKPCWVPETPPEQPLPRWHVTTIRSGGGTVTLTLATAAATGGANLAVAHDDTSAVAAAIDKLNAAGGGYNLTCPGSAHIRYTSELPAITVGDAFVVGSPGCTFLPAGALIGLQFRGPPPAAPCALAGDLAEGSIRVPLASTAGLKPGDFLVIEQPAPADIQAPEISYFHASPIRSIVGNTVTITDPSPFDFAPAFSTITLGGTWAAGDTVTAGVTGRAAVAVTAAAGDTPESLAKRLAVAINAAYRDGIAASNTKSTVAVHIPSGQKTALLASKTAAGGTIAVKQPDAATAAKCRKWNPIARVGLRDVSLDGRDSILSGFALVQAADYEAKGLRIRNVHGGAALWGETLYSGILDDIADVGSGSGAANFTSYATIWMTKFTLLQEANIRSRAPRSFGVQNQAGGWLQAVNVYSSGAEAGRGYKIEGVGAFSLANIAANNAAFSNFSLAYGDRRGAIFGLYAYGGERSLDSNGTCIWNADTYDTLVRYFGVHTAGCHKNDIELGLSDTGNTFTGAVINGGANRVGLGGIYNLGNARFRDINGLDAAAGSAGPTYANGRRTGAASPTGISGPHNEPRNRR
jgi:hypothetical protein